MFQKRNIALNVVLGIVTCGIYFYYWFYQIAKDFYETHTPNALTMTPGVTLLLDIITCGYFSIYVYYKWGQQTPEVFAMYGRSKEDKSTLYLVLGLLMLVLPGVMYIVVLCLVQNDLNELADAGMAPPPYGGGQPPYGGGQPPYGAPQDALYAAAPAYAPPTDGFGNAAPAYTPPTDTFTPEPPPGSPYNPAEPPVSPAEPAVEPTSEATPAPEQPEEPQA